MTCCTDQAQCSVVAAFPMSAITQILLQHEHVAQHFVADVCQTRKSLVVLGHIAS